MIRVTETIALREDEIRERFIRSPGPGGQNVNKTATAVQLRFDVRRSPSLPESVRTRLERLAGGRMTGEGVLVIEASRFRTRERNRRDARERLIALLRKAAQRPRARRKTHPPARAREQRLDAKHRRGTVKKGRGRVSEREP